MTQPTKENSKPTCFVTKLDLNLTDKLKHDLENQRFTFTQPPYSIFSAKKKGLSVTLYESGKLMVQGKAIAEFMEFYLEPEILNSFNYSHPEAYVDKQPRIGVDEAGKGDFFGPLCVASAYADSEQVIKLVKLGVKDSKTMSDKKVLDMAKIIRSLCVHHTIRIGPEKYNELYQKFGNLNHLLAWGHATCIKELVEKTACTNVIIDQFASKTIVPQALKRYQLEVMLTQRHRAEEDVVVAAAACLARAAFLERLAALGKQFEIELPKGASQKTIQTGIKIARKLGPDGLAKVSKKHFKTFDDVMQQC